MAKMARTAICASSSWPKGPGVRPRRRRRDGDGGRGERAPAGGAVGHRRRAGTRPAGRSSSTAAMAP